jgi:MoaA/NifB/PqqE/SkfB family radical SAM enzyme
MPAYSTSKAMRAMPRLPLKGSLDLTYRCNNNCRHCWLRIPPGSPEKQYELTLDEIKAIVDQARAMGCREWSISGGEPMLRPDFAEIFDYVTRKATRYSLNTNGTLITPQIAQLMRRKGSKMVALYGATAEVHDHVTRTPGSFERTMRGFAYLKEAGAGFTVQLIPMRDSYHQWDEMQALARSLSKHWRCGAPWLYLSACGDPERNQEINRQRLDPRDVIELDQPDLSSEEWWEARDEGGRMKDEFAPPSSFIPHPSSFPPDDRLFASCIAGRRDFHVDPYGGMTFCGFIQHPALRYDLRQGSFQEAWDVFIPSLADQVRGGREYLENCAACELRSECRWCPVYGYLEQRRFSAPVRYLCDVAREARRFKDDWKSKHRRYYEVGGITVQVEADLPITDATFHPKFELFRADGPGKDTIRIRHHFSLPDLNGKDLGEEVYRKPPWAIYRKGDAWIYLAIPPTIPPQGRIEDPRCVAVFSRDHSRVRIYHRDDELFRQGDQRALTLFATDQILLAHVLADRQGCYLHSSGAILDGQGLLFVGQSEAGKSTISRMLADRDLTGFQNLSGLRIEVLCDDRNIVRRHPYPPQPPRTQGGAGREGFWVYGTWSHGEWPVVSASSAPLRAIMFLEKAPENRLIPLDDRQEIIRRLLACLIKPFVTADWWEKTLTLVERIAREVPCYVLRFEKSGGVVGVLAGLVRQSAPAE